jgi:hypothetical protein
MNSSLSAERGITVDRLRLMHVGWCTICHVSVHGSGIACRLGCKRAVLLKCCQGGVEPAQLGWWAVTAVVTVWSVQLMIAVYSCFTDS